MTKDLGGAKIYLKARGSEPHRRAQDKQRARSGASSEEDGQDPPHRRDRSRTARRRDRDRGGSASDMECVVFMGKEDTERQALNVYRMRLLGAEVHSRSRAEPPLSKDAVSEAMREWTNRIDGHSLCASAPSWDRTRSRRWSEIFRRSSPKRSKAAADWKRRDGCRTR